MSQALYDSMAHLYDATRRHPPAIEQRITHALEKAAEATSQTTFLEVGIGTGRIALPLASLGYTYTGVDISEKMLQQLERKVLQQGWLEISQTPWGSLPDEDRASTPPVQRFFAKETRTSLRLVRADIRKIPFRDASFDVLLAAHVFHLLKDWQEALQEALRVLRPGGVFLQCWAELDLRDITQIGDAWRKIVSALGEEIHHPVKTFYREMSLPVERITQWLQQRYRAQTEQVQGFSWEEWSTPRELIQTFERRYWSLTWLVPDALFKESLPRLWQWAKQFYGTELDAPRLQKQQVFVSRTRMVSQ